MIIKRLLLTFLAIFILTVGQASAGQSECKKGNMPPDLSSYVLLNNDDVLYYPDHDTDRKLLGIQAVNQFSPPFWYKFKIYDKYGNKLIEFEEYFDGDTENGQWTVFIYKTSNKIARKAFRVAAYQSDCYMPNTGIDSYNAPLNIKAILITFFLIMAVFIIIVYRKKMAIDGSKEIRSKTLKNDLSKNLIQKTAGLFTGETKEYVVGIIAASLIINSISYYVSNASGSGNAPLGIFLFILAIVTYASAILLILARLRYLRLNTLLLILSFIPIVQSIFGLVLIFLQPKSDTPTQPIKTSPPEKKSPAPSPKLSDKDEEIEDLEKQIKIAELKKKLKDIEE